MDSGLQIVGRQNYLRSELSRFTLSKYMDHELSTLVLPSWNSSYEHRSEEYLDLQEDEYDPLTDCFSVRAIEVNDEYYLKPDIEDGCFSFPMVQTVIPGPVVLHGPGEINGLQDGKLFIGAITNVHCKPEVTYTWYRDHIRILTSPHHCILNVRDPGNMNYYLLLKFMHNNYIY